MISVGSAYVCTQLRKVAKKRPELKQWYQILSAAKGIPTEKQGTMLDQN